MVVLSYLGGHSANLFVSDIILRAMCQHVDVSVPTSSFTSAAVGSASVNFQRLVYKDILSQAL